MLESCYKQNEQEIQIRTISESDFTQIIIKKIQKLNIFEKSSTDFSLQNFIIVIQSLSALSTTACESSTKISVNLMSELIYFDLVENKLSTSMNDKMIFFMRDILMFYS